MWTFWLLNAMNETIWWLNAINVNILMVKCNQCKDFNGLMQWV